MRQFDGANPDIVDFVIDQVLEAHDSRTRELILRTSVLERLSGPLCDAVLDTDHSCNVMAELSANNLFLIPQDDRREWYRFHSLLAQLLRIELNTREPDLNPASSTSPLANPTAGSCHPTTASPGRSGGCDALMERRRSDARSLPGQERFEAREAWGMVLDSALSERE